jgi:predicted phosphodiesterase
VKTSRIWTTILAPLILLSPGCGSSSGGPSAGQATNTEPYIQSVTPGSVIISWHTAVALDSRVDFGLTGPDETFVADGALTTFHEVELKGLLEGATYLYKVSSGGETSDESSFTTAPAPGSELRFAVYGDSRSHPADHAAVARAVLRSDPEFVIHVGDIVHEGGDHAAWSSEFFAPAADLIKSRAIYPALGNHEYVGDSTALQYRSFFALPSANERWYSFDYGCAHFVCLDTCIPSNYARGSEQRIWLQDDLAAAQDSPWIFVFFHHPPFTASDGHSDDLYVQADLVPLFEGYGVDMVFSGHTHAYERYTHNGICYIVTGGGGGPLHELIADTKEPIREAGESVLHHVALHVTPTSVALEARRNDGTPIDTLALARDTAP